MDKMKVTKCWTTPQADESPNWCAPSPIDGFDPEERPAVILWEEDYDALLAKILAAFESGYMDGRINELSLHEAKKRFKKEGK